MADDHDDSSLAVEHPDEENLHVLPEEPNQDCPHVPVSSAASKGKYARSRAGWFSQGRSTPEGINMEEHGWRFEQSLPIPLDDHESSSDSDWDTPVVPRERKPRSSPKVRNARREKRVALRQKAARRHAEVALRKYNRANNTKAASIITSQLSSLKVIIPLIPALPSFSELDHRCRNEDDVMLCCIVGKNDAGHCHGCEDYQPVVHPSSQAYGGGGTTFIDLPGSDGDSTNSD